MGAAIRLAGLVVTLGCSWLFFSSVGSSKPSGQNLAVGGVGILVGLLLFALGRIVADLFGGNQKVVLEVRGEKKRRPALPPVKPAAKDGDWLDRLQ